jgi:hypothetical protein
MINLFYKRKVKTLGIYYTRNIVSGRLPSRHKCAALMSGNTVWRVGLHSQRKM